MSAIYPIKETVKVITVTKQNQKIHFQLRHPENVSTMIGIAVTASLSTLSDIVPPVPALNDSNMAGHLSLALPQKGDVVFSDDVKIDNNDYADIPEKIIYGLQSNIAASKKRQYYFETEYKTDRAVLEGYYEDIFAPSLTDENGILKPFLYKVRIYVRYQVKKTEIKEKP